jgi:sugar/nucleoside kinase (ribokinase family)
MAQYDVVVLGEINADLILRGDVEPEWQQHEKIVDDMALVLGGSAVFLHVGWRVSASASPTWAFVVMIPSQVSSTELNAAGIDTRHVIIDPAVRSGLTLICKNLLTAAC